MIERAFNGTTSAYPAPGASAGSGTVTQNNTIGDLFGAQALLEGSFGVMVNSLCEQMFLVFLNKTYPMQPGWLVKSLSRLNCHS
ncbi:hypothetical protein AAF134_11640 [Synechococcus lacustris Tous-12m]